MVGKTLLEYRIEVTMVSRGRSRRESTPAEELDAIYYVGFDVEGICDLDVSISYAEP